MKRASRGGGPNPADAHLKLELDRHRREAERLKKQVAELESTRERLSKLYFSQVDDNRKRAQKLHHLLEVVSRINSTLDLGALLDHIVSTIQQSLGFRIVLLRIREPGGRELRASAFAGLSDEARKLLLARPVVAEDFVSWLRDEFRVSRSYYISHKHSFSRILPEGFVPDLGERAEWEWHEDDVLLVPLFSRSGDLLGYFSVDDPVDRLIPSQEVVELLEIFGNHAVVAIENARLYQALEQRNRQLEEAGHRMQELNALKSNIVSTVSHELRTPLTAIRAYVDALLAAHGSVEPDQLYRFLVIIDEESQRLARLIESVLDLSHFDSGTVRTERHPVEIGEIVRETQGMLAPLAQTAHVALKVSETGADTVVEADRDQMRQLVLHIGSNAVKFTPPGGEVRFLVGAEDDQVVLVVEDTGIGIAERELERIFDRFYQVDSSLVRRYGGTGLGLAICKSIVDWHGGRIHVESTPGRGSRFTVQLPRRQRPRVVVRIATQPDAACGDVLRMAVEMVSEVMGARVVSLMGVSPEGDLQIQAAQGLDPRLLDEVRIPVGQGVAGWVAQHRRPVCVARPDEQAEVAPSGRSQYRSGTFLSVPLEGRGGLLGVLNVTDPASRRPFAAEDCHLLLALAARVSAALEQAQQPGGEPMGGEAAAEALRRVLLNVHQRRRSAPNRVRLARAMARRLGLSEADAGVVGYVASVYDEGVAAIGREVLAGARGLEADAVGAATAQGGRGTEILRPLEVVGAVREMILAHHEWWDGSGYPRGLKNDQIPLGARILAVVDAFETITTGRGFRPARAGREALDEIRALAGTQLDPAVVQSLVEAIPEVELDDEAESVTDGELEPSEARR